VPGVIALLDDANAARVEALWDAMGREFGVPRGYPGAVPHISFHLGSHDVEAAAETIVRGVSRETPPFTVHSAGLGVFGGPVPVLYLTVGRSPEASKLATVLTERLAAAGFPSTDPYFTADKWVPHITIAHKNLEAVELGPLLAWLVDQPLAWEIPLGSLSIARETDIGAEILATFPLGG
jgi:2'-5' RNA ligase